MSFLTIQNPSFLHLHTSQITVPVIIRFSQNSVKKKEFDSSQAQDRFKQKPFLYAKNNKNKTKIQNLSKKFKKKKKNPKEKVL